ncbi:MAG: orotidine-5'-phosphate decarboxylase [Acetobacteraceae bacterium]|nr:orotidine-5'-phosphate decarboxylase [Acetobacteraceae bacterium]
MPDATHPAASDPRGLPAAMADRLIVALDVPDPAQARAMVERLDGVVSFFKIGMWLLFADGTDRLLTDLVRSGKQVFLDYKMFDIGETVKQGVARAVERGVRFVTVHGDPEIMRAAVAGKGGSDHTKIFAITVLTSLDDRALREMGYGLGVKELIALRVQKAIECGCDGIIASPDDRPDEIRRMVRGDRLLIATPGVRPAGASVDDHKRHATPQDAIANGADYLVIGRPIVQAADPVASARAIIRDMEAGAALRAAP